MGVLTEEKILDFASQRVEPDVLWGNSQGITIRDKGHYDDTGWMKEILALSGGFGLKIGGGTSRVLKQVRRFSTLRSTSHGFSCEIV